MQAVDFTRAAACEGWHSIDDRIMGGLSISRLRHEPAGYAVFEGTVSLDNGGGFASVRHGNRHLGSTRTTGYLMEVMGDGRCYKLNLRTDQTFDGVNYQAEFQPPAGQWSTVELPLSDFMPKFRGRMVADAPPLAPGRVCQVGLMISDQQWGSFALLVRSISCMEC